VLVIELCPSHRAKVGNRWRRQADTKNAITVGTGRDLSATGLIARKRSALHDSQIAQRWRVASANTYRLTWADQIPDHPGVGLN
jgi:hypothetical protein